MGQAGSPCRSPPGLARLGTARQCLSSLLRAQSGLGAGRDVRLVPSLEKQGMEQGGTMCMAAEKPGMGVADWCLPRRLPGEVASWALHCKSALAQLPAASQSGRHCRKKGFITARAALHISSPVHNALWFRAVAYGQTHNCRCLAGRYNPVGFPFRVTVAVSGCGAVCRHRSFGLLGLGKPRFSHGKCKFLWSVLMLSIQRRKS